jgi:hypothetical protein
VHARFRCAQEIPKALSLARARRMPELAILSALFHGRNTDAQRTIELAVRAARSLDEERAGTYLDLIDSTLGRFARAALETAMPLPGYEYKGEFAKKYYGEGRAEGARAALLAVAAARGIGLSRDARARIAECPDFTVLEQWIKAAAGATSEQDVIAT